MNTNGYRRLAASEKTIPLAVRICGGPGARRIVWPQTSPLDFVGNSASQFCLGGHPKPAIEGHFKTGQHKPLNQDVNSGVRASTLASM